MALSTWESHAPFVWVLIWVSLFTVFGNRYSWRVCACKPLPNTCNLLHCTVKATRAKCSPEHSVTQFMCTLFFNFHLLNSAVRVLLPSSAPCFTIEQSRGEINEMKIIWPKMRRTWYTTASAIKAPQQVLICVNMLTPSKILMQ